MKEIEELMKPRFKVIADYPDRKFPMEEVIHLKLYEGTQKPIPNTWYGIEVKGSPGIWDEAYFEKYPHLFRKLCWWEERSIEDIKEIKYVMYTESENKEVHEVTEWGNDRYYGVYCLTKESANFRRFPGECKLLPSTIQEYQSYQSINSLK